MSSPESSEPGRSPTLSSTTIPDLTGRITRPDDQYCEAGAFGDVFRCRYASAHGIQLEVAVKAFRFNFTVDEDHRGDEGKTARMIRRELGIWSRLNHRNVVPFLGIVYGFGRQRSASLVSIWMPHGTLHAFLEACGDQLAVPHRLQLLLDIANGLHYLHSFPLVHGDLTSNNVLLDHNYNACLTDFGCASLVGEHPEGFTYLRMSTVRPGTLRWAAPEHFSLDEGEAKYTPKSDIYSFGNMALLVLTGKYPWSEIRVDAAVVLQLSQGRKPRRPIEPAIDDRHWALIERCWVSVLERPLAEDVAFSLQQFLSAYLTLQPLRDSFLVSSNVTDGASKDDLGEVKPMTATTGEHVSDASPSGPPPPPKFIRGDFLASGTYGHIYLARDSSTGEMIAIKQVEKGRKDNRYRNFVRELKRERAILGGLNHLHIVAYLRSEETASFVNIHMEYIPGGSIARRLREYGRFKEEVVKSFITQTLDGLAYLHANGIIHRSIEVYNILVDASGTCKICGFGNAQRAGDEGASRIPLRGVSDWTAPEMIQTRDGKRYGPKVDIWSVGCVVLRMWVGSDREVFQSMVKAAHQGTLPSLPFNVISSDSAIDFRNRCFAMDPEARPGAIELMQHPYLTLAPDWVFTGFI